MRNQNDSPTVIATITEWGHNDYSLEYLDLNEDSNNRLFETTEPSCTASSRGKAESILEEVKHLIGSRASSPHVDTYTGDYIALCFDDEGILYCIIGTYSSLKEAMRQAEAYIAMLVEDGDYVEKRSYETLRQMGLGIQDGWSDTEIEGGVCTTWKYDSTSVPEEIVILPANIRRNEDYTRHLR